jgi:hypothetical protein
MGGVRVDSVQCNSFNSSIVATAATFNGTANITVASTANLAVGMPVVVSASAGFTATPFSGALNGFVYGQIYFIASIVGSVITLANSNYGAAIVASGSVSGFIVSSGFPCLEFTATDASSAITSLIVWDADAEAGGTTKILLQNCQGAIFKTNSTAVDSPNIQYSQQYITLRGSAYSDIECSSPLTLIDSSAGDTNNNAWSLIGQKGTILGQAPAGIFADNLNGNRASLNLGQNLVGGIPSFYNIVNIGGLGADGTVQGLPLAGYSSGNYANTALSLSLVTLGGVGLISYTGSTSTTWTMPAITATAEGLEWCVANSGTAAAVLTLSAGTGQFFNLTTRASITLAVGASITLAARYNGGTPYWQVKGIGGAYSAGAVTTM